MMKSCSAGGEVEVSSVLMPDGCVSLGKTLSSLGSDVSDDGTTVFRMKEQLGMLCTLAIP